MGIDDGVQKDGENIWNRGCFANAIKTMNESKTEQIKFIQFFAELRFAKYKALIEAGFTKEQALHIVTNTKVMD